MPIIASEVMLASAALLNDHTQRLYTNAKLLPYLKMAYKDLLLEFTLLGNRLLDEVSTDILVVAGTTVLTAPSNLIQPLELHERDPDENGEWTPMREERWEPDATPGTTLIYWVWREEVIQFLGATTDREVRVKYKKTLNPIVDENSSIAVLDGDAFLSFRTAGLAARYSGENYTRADQLDNEAGRALRLLTGRDVKRQQGVPVRRRRYGTTLRRITG